MWQVLNRTPFAAAQSWARNLDGAETWIVAVKASFDIQPDGSLIIAETQPLPVRAPVYRGEPGQSSIEYENDFVLTKTTTDVVVNATAYAPGGRPEPYVDVGFAVGPIQKVLRVFGDRFWGRSGMLSGPQPFVTMPVTYDRAFGGRDPASPNPDVDWYWPNPVGTGFAVSDRALTAIRVWNVEYPDDPIRSWKARPKPAGFGAIGPNWQDRAKFAGTYDDAWAKERQPLLPVDFDPRYFQAVPLDQQAPRFLSGGEPVSLQNLTPSGRLQFALPTMDIRWETRFADGERRQHPPGQLHTVILEPDVPRVSLVWHSAIECHSKVYKLEQTRVTVEQVQNQAWDEEVESLLEL
jgi:hypothetical protein